MRTGFAMALLLAAAACGGSASNGKDRDDHGPGSEDDGRYFGCADGSNLCTFSCTEPLPFDACAYHGEPACPEGSVNLITEGCPTCGGSWPVECFESCDGAPLRQVAPRCVDEEWRCVDGAVEASDCT